MIHNQKLNSKQRPYNTGWLEQMPKHWEVIPVKRYYSIKLGKMLQNNAQKSEDIEIPYLKAQHVQWFSVQTTNLPKMWATPFDIEQYSVQKGDLLVCEGGEGGRCGIINNVEQMCIIQNALHRVRSSSKSNNKYLQYVMRTISTIGWFDAINNKATIAHFTKEKFGSLEIPFPPLKEQTAIVQYLDYMNQRIRRLIRAKRDLVALLNEQKQVIIHHAVTHGLDPNVPLGDSAIEWLDKVPKHWEIRRLRNTVEMRVSSVDKHTKTDEKPIRLCNYVDVYKNDYIDQQIIFMRATATSQEIERFRLKKDDVLITKDSETWDDIGVPALVTEPADDLISGYHLALLRPHSDKLNGGYLLRVLQSKVISYQFHVEAKGVTRYGLSHTGIKSVWLPLPPLSEQIAISEYLDRVTADIDAAIARTNREIELLEEYRTRLISDVVTGKVDVREAAAALPEADPLAEDDESNDELDPDITSDEEYGTGDEEEEA